MAMTMVIFTLYSLLVTELTGEMTYLDRVRSFLIGGMALITAFYMLWHRLPDAISSSICRSAHDFYVETKKHDFYREGSVELRSRRDSFA